MTDLVRYDFHPLANIFPLLEGVAFAELVEDVRLHGVREPVWMYQGQILDGQNRWHAAQAAGVKCQTREYTGNDPAAVVVSLNLHRRHLNESQRAMVAARVATFKNGRRADQVGGLPIGRAAELLNVGERTAARAREVVRDGAPELIAAVARGEIAVSAAAQVARLPRDTQADIVATGPEEVREVAKTLRGTQEVGARSQGRGAKPTGAHRVAILTVVTELLAEALADVYRPEELDDVPAFLAVYAKQKPLFLEISTRLARLDLDTRRTLGQMSSEGRLGQTRRKRPPANAAPVAEPMLEPDRVQR